MELVEWDQLDVNEEGHHRTGDLLHHQDMLFFDILGGVLYFG